MFYEVILFCLNGQNSDFDLVHFGRITEMPALYYKNSSHNMWNKFLNMRIIGDNYFLILKIQYYHIMFLRKPICWNITLKLWKRTKYKWYHIKYNRFTSRKNSTLNVLLFGLNVVADWFSAIWCFCTVLKKGHKYMYRAESCPSQLIASKNTGN